MRILYLVFVFLGSLLLGACNDGSPVVTEEPVVVEEEGYKLPGNTANLYQIVMDKHDTTMLMMSPIIRTQHLLRDKSKTAEGAEKKAILDALLALEKGDEGMRRWMREFKNIVTHEDTYRAWSETEIRAYLKEEERKIEQVDVDMRTSIAQGEALLK